MGRTLRRVISTSLTCLLMVALAAPAGAALTDRDRALHAAGFVASQQKDDGSFPAFSTVGSTADAVLAFVAAGAGAREIRRSLRFLASEVTAGGVDTEGLQAKVVLAWTAAGRGPRTIGGMNIVRELKAGWSGGPANEDAHTVYDTALTVLALDAAGVTAPEPAVSFLWSQQCADGGWDYDATNVGEDAHCQGDPDTDFFASDTNTTALVVMALQGAPIPIVGGQPVPLGPFDFFDAIRDEAHGGWGYTWGFETSDANSTGLVLQAYVSEGVPPPAGSRTALRRLQYGRCGAFAYSWDGDVRMAPDLGATIGAIPGLMGTAFPFAGSVEAPAPDVPVCAA